ncbi:MAG: hypothetical protein GY854_19305 [Deltaproteobacteria bacterium]|nr:hypothetical protein [Deltaproteobacteria bacterium]
MNIYCYIFENDNFLSIGQTAPLSPEIGAIVNYTSGNEELELVVTKIEEAPCPSTNKLFNVFCEE